MSRFLEELATTTPPSTASQLRARGVTPGQLRGRAWWRIGQGLYLPAEAPNGVEPVAVGSVVGGSAAGRRASAAQRIVNCLPLLTEGEALGGWAAGYVLGADWLDGMNPWTGELLPIDVVGRCRRRPRPLIRYRFARRDVEMITRHGLVITSALQTAVDCARWAESVEEALVVLDAMVEFKVVSTSRLASCLPDLGSLHGIDRLRAAVPLVRRNVWSPWESRLRYCYGVQVKLPEPLINVRLFDDEGCFLGNPDLFEPESALAVEFDGQHHRERRQHRKDNIREEEFESVNVTVVRVDSLDMWQKRRPALIRRILDGYRRGVRRDRRHDRWLLDPAVWF